jgi:Caudovirus prohead serine protease
MLRRHPTTLTTEDRDDGFAWAADLPTSPAGEDVRVAVERGDLRASSWRQVVARDYWDRDVRHVAEISHLLDVTVTAAPAYAAAAAELRSQTPNPADGQEDTMAETAEKTKTGAEDRAMTTNETPVGSGGATTSTTATAGRPDALDDERDLAADRGGEVQ